MLREAAKPVKNTKSLIFNVIEAEHLNGFMTGQIRSQILVLGYITSPQPLRSENTVPRHALTAPIPVL